MPFPRDVPRLSDGVVTLRAHRPDDVPRMVEQCRDPGSVRWTTVPSPYTHADAAGFLGDLVPRTWDAGTAAYLAVEHEERFVGTIDLRFADHGTAEVGFGLHPDARGRGVGRRMLGLALDWGFAERGLAVVRWRAQRGNWASRRVAWATGFSFGPTVPGLLVQRGLRRDAWTGWLGRDDPRTPTTRWLDPEVLERGGVRLRAWRPHDGAVLAEAAHDPVLRDGIPWSPLPLGPGEVDTYLLQVREAMAEGRRVAWCVADTATDRALGNVAVFGFDDGSAEVGYWAHPHGRGRGAMATAVQLAADHAADALGVRRLDLLTAASNDRSRRLAERVGFRLVGVESASAPTTDGGWQDTARYELVLARG